MFTEHPEAGTGEPPVETVEETAIDTGEGESGSEDEGQGGKKKVVIDQQEYISLKVGAERRNQIEAENERLKAERDTRNTTDDRVSEADDARNSLEDQQRQLENDRAYLRRVEAFAKANPGPEGEEARAALAVVRTAVAASERSIASEERVLYKLEMADIPKEKQEAVRKLIRETPGLRSPALAHRFLKGDEHETLAQENARLREENDKLKKPAPRAPEPIRGGTKSPTTKNGVEEITLDEYQARMSDPLKYNTTKRARDGGKLVIRKG